MGSLEDRIRRLEERAPDTLSEQEDDEKLRRRRVITRMLLDEVARLRRSGETRDVLERAVRHVVEDQYEDLSPESRQSIADHWIETINSWGRLDWMVSAGREAPA